MGDIRFTAGRLSIDPPLTPGQRAELDHVRRLHEEAQNLKRDWRPGWCSWGVSADGGELTLDGGGHFVLAHVDGVERLIREYLAPWGRSVSGHIVWADGGESGGESGVVFADRNRVECVWDERVNRGPSWARGYSKWDGDRYVPFDPATGTG